MTYPASPGDAGTRRVQVDHAQFWAGAAATAIVAALIALVGMLICRWTLNIPILAPAGDGAWGNAHSTQYVIGSALVALIAGGLLYLLVLWTPRPHLFFDWIMALATLAAVVYPFSTSAPLDQKGATAIVNLVLGIAITSLLTAVTARAVRSVRRLPPPGPPYYDDGTRYGPDRRYGVPDQRYGPAQGQGQIPTRPVRPVNAPQERDPRRWE